MWAQASLHTLSSLRGGWTEQGGQGELQPPGHHSSPNQCPTFLLPGASIHPYLQGPLFRGLSSLTRLQAPFPAASGRARIVKTQGGSRKHSLLNPTPSFPQPVPRPQQRAVLHPLPTEGPSSVGLGKEGRVLAVPAAILPRVTAITEPQRPSSPLGLHSLAVSRGLHENPTHMTLGGDVATFPGAGRGAQGGIQE